MKPVYLTVAVVCLALLVSQGAARAEEPLLYGGGHLSAGPSDLVSALATDSQVATWLTFRYDALKEAGVSVPGQKEFQTWLVAGRCRWIEGLNLAAGYEIWVPSLDGLTEIHTARGGISYHLDGFNLRNKAAELSVERSSFSDPAREPSYGAVAAFTMQF
jgi:hypothetical protein